MDTKVIAMYLPQYHSIPENDEFWGMGFTDWVSVRNSKPLYEGHNQPRVPENYYYYDLSVEKDVRCQAKLAKENGVYGFGIYHYWFNNEKNLLTKPAEIFLNNVDIDINFFFAWDNISWKRSWSNVKGNDWSPLVDSENKETNKAKKGPAILIEHILGTEADWENHFNHILPYLQDSRYIKVDNKPVFVIYHYNDTILKMGEYWDMLAKKHGMGGMYMVYRDDKIVKLPVGVNRFTYEPASSAWGGILERACEKIAKYLKMKPHLKTYDYDKVWKKIIEKTKSIKDSNHWPGAFVTYDDTPRRGIRGKVVVNETPEKFQKYMETLLLLTKRQKKEFVLLTAWNEWGEGAYLEPDTVNHDRYLQALRKAIINSSTNE